MLNTDIGTNPMIGMFPDDTLHACRNVLAYLQSVRPLDTHSDNEISGLYMIHEVVKHALAYEIERASACRKRVAPVEANV